MPEDTPAPIDAEALQRAIAALQPPQAATQAPSGADEGDSSQGWLGHLLARIGNAEAGGPTGLLGLTRDQSDTAGLRAMLASGAGMLAASGPSYVPKDFGTVLAAGIGNAMQSRQGSEGAAFTARGAQNALAQQAFQNRIAAIKEAIPLLQLDYQQKLLAAQRASALAATGGGKGTSIADAAADPVAALPREQALDALAQRESGWKNVPNAEGGDASGYWQIRDATWRDGAKLAGVDVSKYPRAIDAPKDVQRQVAGAIYDRDGAKPWAASAPGRGVAARTGGTDVAGPGAGKTTPDAPTAPALPLPPAPPPEGIPVPGGSGMRVYPDGKIGTPGQEGRPPATQIATAAPAVAPGATTAAPATTAPAVTAPAATAPTPPPVTPTTIPDTFTEFKKQHPEELTPSDEERATWSTSPDPAQLKNVQQQRQDAEDRIRAARAAIPTSTDPSKQTAEIDAAKKDLDIAITAENTMREDARKTGMERRANWYKDREAQMATNYNAAVTARDTRQTNRDAIINAANQKGLEQAQTDYGNARDVGSQLQGFSAMSEGIGQPGWLQTTKFPGSDHTIAEQLQQAGIKLDDTAGAQLLRGGIANLVKTLRAGMPMGSLSDRDLNFIERLGPTEWMDRDTRAAAVGYLRQAYKAKQDFAFEVQKQMTKGANYSDAIDAANAKAKPIVPTVPADITAHWTDNSPEWAQKRVQWATQNDVRGGTLYHLNDGSIHVMRSARPPGQP